MIALKHEFDENKINYKEELIPYCKVEIHNQALYSTML